MFKVDIKREEGMISYFVYDRGEVIETEGFRFRSFKILNSKVLEIAKIIPFEKGAMYIYQNKVPVMISEKDMQEYVETFEHSIKTNIFAEDPGNLPVISVTDEEYKILETLYNYQNNETNEVEKDISEAKKMVKQYQKDSIDPNHQYRTF